MFKCTGCGKQFSTMQALGGHTRMGCRSPTSLQASKQANMQANRHEMQASKYASKQASTALAEAEETAKKYQLTRKRYGQVQISYGRLFAALAIGGFVAWLVYKALENWDWKGISSKRQISPYKLIGGLITGLG